MSEMKAFYQMRRMWLGWRLDRAKHLWGKCEREANRLINVPRNDFDSELWHKTMDKASRYFSLHGKLYGRYARMVKRHYEKTPASAPDNSDL